MEAMVSKPYRPLWSREVHPQLVRTCESQVPQMTPTSVESKAGHNPTGLMPKTG